MRPKWDSPRNGSTYGRRTVEKAIACGASYDPDFNRGPAPSANGNAKHQSAGSESVPVGDQPAPATQPAPRFKMIDSAEFLAGDYRPRWLVPRVLVRGQPGVIAGPSKGMKTSLLIDLAVSMATATPFLGEFPIRDRVRVAVVSGESGEHTLKETCLRVLAAKELDPAALTGWLKWEFKLPTFSDLESMTAFGESLARVGADVVIIDPTYLALGNVDAKNMFEMGGALRMVADVLRSLRPDITVILVHHANRLLPVGEPMELQHLAYSGLEQFARQFILLNRREAYRNDGEHDLWVRAGGSTGHGGLWAVHVSEGIVEEDFGGRRWNVSVSSPEGARRTEQVQKRNDKAALKVAQDRLDEQAVMLVIDAEAKRGLPGASLSWIADTARLTDGSKMSDERARRAVDRLLEAGAVVKVPEFQKPLPNNGWRKVTNGFGRPAEA